jgi:hypothetical protein
MFGSETVKLCYDTMRGLNQTIWNGEVGAKKVETIVKTGLSGADVVIGASHAMEDIACNDKICSTLDIIASVSSAVGMVLGNLPSTSGKSLTVVDDRLP